MGGRSDIATRLRLASGLVLMAFACTHLLNHTLGIHSLGAMEAGGRFFTAVWRTVPATLLLYAAFVVHVVLALHKLWRRRRLKMPAWETAQVGLGFLIPFWLVVHIIGTRGSYQFFGVDDTYSYVLNTLWPENAARQSLMLVLVWLHGCIGVHFWLRLRPWYRPLRPWLFAPALLLPTLALIGFADAGRELRARAESDPAWLERRAAAENWLQPSEMGWIYATERQVLLGFTVVLLATLGARAVRGTWARYGRRVRLRYPNGVTVVIEPGMSVLEASRAAGVPHASVCGGRGRCSTCRVRLGDGAEHLPPPAPDEARVLARIGAGDDVRLACQLRPTHELAVVPLLPASAGPQDVRVQVNPGLGIEREVAVLFADLRAFTRMSEGRLPYDVVFLLNQYFKATGQAVEAQGGRVDKFIGDGIMALFGVDLEPEAACRQALAAAKAMAFALEQLNLELAADLGEPLRIGIGLHVGPAILGEMGFGRAASLTAIGDTVNVAARLEALTKDFDVQMVASTRLAERAGIDLGAFEERRIEIRGRRRPLRVRLVGEARALPLEVA
ncbi:MAG: adenylate/guanylate cyclase domain-containing protein, partial [Geminicoccaceae bacterium]